MIRISVEVRSPATCFSVRVRAESIERAVQVTSTHYPGSEFRVLFPIDPEAFFAEDSVPAPEQIWVEVPEVAAG